MNYLNQIAELEDKRDMLTEELEALETEWMDEQEREERAEELRYALEDLEDEIEQLETQYEDWKYSRGDQWTLNGIDQRELV